MVDWDVNGKSTEFKSINTKLRFMMDSYRSLLVSKSSIKTIISIKNGISTMLTNIVR
jgi:hypothetical protein